MTEMIIQRYDKHKCLLVNPSSLDSIFTTVEVANIILGCRQGNMEVLSCSWLDEASICLHEFLIDLIDASQQPLARRCWCVWRFSLSVDGQWGNMSGITLTHQPQGPLLLPQDGSSHIYTEQVRIIPFAASSSLISSVCLRALPSFSSFFFVCCCFARQLTKYCPLSHCAPQNSRQ